MPKLEPQHAHRNCTLLRPPVSAPDPASTPNINSQSLDGLTFRPNAAGLGGVSCFHKSQICCTSISWSRCRHLGDSLACAASTKLSDASFGSATTCLCGHPPAVSIRPTHSRLGRRHEPRNKPRLVALLRVLFESRPRHLPEVFLHAVALPTDTLQERGPALRRAPPRNLLPTLCGRTRRALYSATRA